MLPNVTQPVRLDDLPALLAPYATTAPIFVYLLSSGHILASRMRLRDDDLDDDDLILMLSPRRTACSGGLRFSSNSA